VWFREAYNTYTGPDYGRLSMPFSLGDNQGDRIELNWLGAAPQLQEHKGEKRPKGLNASNLSLVVRDFEATIKIHKNALKDGKWNLYEPRIREMAQNARRQPWKMLRDLIVNNKFAYDGQNFFDVDHSEGKSGPQSNVIVGSGTSVAQIQSDMFKGRARMQKLVDDQGEYWGIPGADFYVIPPDMEEAFAKLRAQVLQGNGETNVMQGSFDYEVEPGLSDTNDYYGFYTKGSMKPFIFLEREAPHPVNLIDPEASEAAFMKKELYYSVEARREAGYGMWQYAQKFTNA